MRKLWFLTVKLQRKSDLFFTFRKPFNSQK